MAPTRRTTRATPATTTKPTTTVTDAQLQALIDRGVAAALAEREADMSRNGDNNNDSGSDRRRQVPIQRECIYTDFLKCQPKNFKGTEGVVGSALMWWNSHVRAVGQDVSYAMQWTTLKRIITDKYCPRGEIQKLESEYWNLKPFKRNNVARVYTVGPGDKKPYEGIKHLCPKYNYDHDGPCAPKCTNSTALLQVKLSLPFFTLEGSALMWWNSHVRAVGQDVSYAMQWTTLKRIITDKYCPRGEIQKLESEY
nr:hypothetical protein [Tanacetum cinerariifolium]